MEQKSSVVINDSLVIDTCVGLTALRLYIKNANMEVGQVTVRHHVFSELIVQVRSDKGLRDAEEVFALCFNNKHTKAEGKGKKVYESPLAAVDENGKPLYYYNDEFGIECIQISPRLADLIYEEVKLMEINEANVIAACQDLITCGRMFQELTIDACKTMFNVVIPYGQDMEHCHLMSQDNSEDDFNMRPDWKYLNSTEEEQERMRAQAIRSQFSYGNGNPKAWKKFKTVNYVFNTTGSKTINERRGERIVKVRRIADFQQDIRKALLTLGMNFADEMMQEKQDFSQSIRAEISQAMVRSNMKDALNLALFFHDAFRTIVSFQTKSISDARAKYPHGSAALEEHIKGIKKDARIAMMELTNQFRLEFSRLGLSERDYILVMLHVVISENNNSSYAHMLLEEEFFKFAISCYENDEASPKFSEDRLIYCDFNDGEWIKFEAGKAQCVDGRKAVATVPLCGTFLIRQNQFGKMVASQPLTDLVKAPEVVDNHLVFITKPGGGKDSFTSRNLQRITRKIVEPGVRVTLVPFIKGKDIHDAIVVDDTVIGSFRCSFSICGQPQNAQSLTNMYMYKQGTVANVIVSNQGGSVGDVAFIVLKDVETVAAPKIKHNWVTEEREKNIAAMRERVKNRSSIGSKVLRSTRFTQGETKTISLDNNEPDIIIAPKVKTKKPVIVSNVSVARRFAKYGAVGF